jgi:hypothetical protein
MTFVNYFGKDFPEIGRAELLYVGEEFSHIAILGTHTIAVVPNEDIAPA